ncbi:TPA: hypothetical protein VJU12_001807 [Streptococcus pyogenes]|nr:hypothetical protein [Streptococcus pyogenes]HER2376020.1 hypothetical protein [Streptococcus pyogenes]
MQDITIRIVAKTLNITTATKILAKQLIKAKHPDTTSSSISSKLKFNKCHPMCSASLLAKKRFKWNC